MIKRFIKRVIKKIDRTFNFSNTYAGTIKFRSGTGIQVGAMSELIFESIMSSQDYVVSKPIVDEFGIDYILYKDGQYKKVQVKGTGKSSTVCLTNAHKSKYYKNLVDYIAFVSFPNNMLYMIPTDIIPAGRKKASIIELSKISKNIKQPINTYAIGK